MTDSNFAESFDGTPPRCFFVGMGNLAVACVNILAKSGYHIIGIHSADGSLIDTARDANITYYGALADFALALSDSEFEWLFSINNPWVIPSSVLKLPKMATLNYHDSPLPKYRGMYATTWALIHGEKTHAISFHEVTENIDAGRIFRQSEVFVSPEDTAWSLNAKCFEKAIETFRELATDLRRVPSRDKIVTHTQDSSKGSYFGRWKRPTQVAILDFSKSAESIRNLTRALDFGPIDNALGTVKVFTGREFISVGCAEILTEKTTRFHGEIVGHSKESIDITTPTGTVRLSKITTLDGSSIDIENLIEVITRDTGNRLVGLTEQQADTITRRYGELCRHEAYWVRLLASARFADLGLAKGAAHSPGAQQLMAGISAVTVGFEQREVLLKVASYLAVFLAKANDVETFDFGFSVSESDSLLKALFSPVVPIRVERNPQQPLSEFLDQFTVTFDNAKSKGSYIRDVVLRYGDLRGSKLLKYGVALGEHRTQLPDTLAELYVGIDVEKREVWLTHHGVLQPWQVASIDDALTRIAREAQSSNTVPIAQVPWTSEEVRRKVLVEWNENAEPIPDESIYTIIKRRSIENPHACAVSAAGVDISYAELFAKSRQVAQHLANIGVRSGDLVALSLPRSCNVVIAMLAILQLGAAYLPIDPTYPADRGRGMVTDAKVQTAVCIPELHDKFFNETPRVLLMSDLIFSPSGEEFTPKSDTLIEPIQHTGLFCVIYTSGSTGKPKGVEITHRGMVNHGLAIARNYSLGNGDRVLCSASIGFDVFGEQVYPTLLAGAKVVMRPDDLFDSFRRFQDFITAEAITVAILPTSFWHEWTRELVVTHSEPPSSLRVLCVGTEKALVDALTQWQSVSKGRTRFFQGYGPTETTITSTMYLHDGQPADHELPIGKPLPNTQVYLLDSGLEPVPIGNAGEIYITGIGVARGYRNSPTMTAERFLDCPFRPDSKMYRTGDLARFRQDGQLVFLGRVDSQVKIRGFRVELQEIEKALTAHPNVSEAVVLLRNDLGDPQLVGYVVTRTDDVDEVTLLDIAARHLPDYMVPKTIVKLARFPKTSNQKIDKRALPPPPRSTSIYRKSPPTSVTQRQGSLIKIWSDLLGERPGIDEDFFTIGGHSLLAVRMLSIVERTHKTLIPLSQFVQNPSIVGLDRLLDKTDNQSSIIVTVQAGTRRPPLWLVHPVGGHVVYAYRLRKHMAPYQPIMGIQAQGVDGRLPPIEGIRAMATAYVQRLCELQPQGPYFVSGPSMGGLIALEMAQLLSRLGKEVALLALIDTWGPGYPRPTSFLQRTFDQFRTLRVTPNWRERIALVRDRWNRRFEIQVNSQGRIMPQHYALQDESPLSPEMLVAMRRVWDANERANLEYEPSTYSGNVLLIRASQTLKWSGMRFDDPFNGWRRLFTGKFDCQTIDVGHSELVDNPPGNAALCLQSAIDSAWNRTFDSAQVRCAS
jgi:amino acid adenylation domain-containing protein